MFYKEWSSDDTWLPSQGISILEGAHQSGHLPIGGTPKLVRPTFASDDLQKITTTVRKVAGYLEKSEAKEWWDKWILEAEDIVTADQVVSVPQGIHTCT